MDDFKQAKSAYQENRTLRFGYRLVQLRELYNAIVQNHTELLKAAQTDTGRPLAVWQHTYRHVLDGIVVEARSLLFQLNKGQKHKLSVVPDSTVLVIGTEQDPFGSVLYPLAIAMAAGSCVVLKPSARSPHTTELLNRLIQGLDREAFSVTSESIQDLLKVDWKTIISVGSSLGLERRSRKSKVIELETGLNVFCSLDTLSSDVEVAARTLAQAATDHHPQAFFHVAVILQAKLQAVKTLVSNRLSATRITEESASYLETARRTEGLVFVAVTSTEEALLYLTKLNITRLTYLGDRAHGEYILKFLPDVSCGYVNEYSPNQLYSNLTVQDFQSRRHVSTKEAMSLVNATSVPPFPHLKIDYPHPLGFFLQGYEVAKAVIGVTSTAAVLSLGFLAWRYIGPRTLGLKRN